MVSYLKRRLVGLFVILLGIYTSLDYTVTWSYLPLFEPAYSVGFTMGMTTVTGMMFLFYPNWGAQTETDDAV